MNEAVRIDLAGSSAASTPLSLPQQAKPKRASCPSRLSASPPPLLPPPPTTPPPSPDGDLHEEGQTFDTTGKVLYGPVPTNNVFKGFGGTCEARNNGDAVVRYDQLADRWLIVMPIFRARPTRPDQPQMDAGDPG